MNHAEKVKSLASEYGSARALFLCSAHERNALHAAIDEMQDEIERLTKDAERYRFIRVQRGPISSMASTKP